MMRKKFGIVLSVIVFVVIAIFTFRVFALNNPNINNICVVEKKGETTHGNYELGITETHLQESNGYLGTISLSADDGYYVKNMTVQYKNEDLTLGFEAGAENGNFFREYDFNPLESYYQFIIPDDEGNFASDKIEIEITYARRAPITITYQNYTGTAYDDNSLHNASNYGVSHDLIAGYRDGDIVLPEDITTNGGLLKLQFASADDFNDYKNVKDEEDQFIRASSGVDHNNYLGASGNDCNDEGNYCYVAVLKDFKNSTVGSLRIGYTRLNLFTKDYVGFTVSTNISNFDDILHETGSEEIGFSDSKKETTVEIFYGTKKLYLTKKSPKNVICDGDNHSESSRSFNNVTGEGYGYSASYNNGVATITLDKYYQDELELDLNILNNSENILGGSVKIRLSRFAFAGNAGQLLEVDANGNNCNEDNNHNTCDQGIYYSTQYRGILSAFYVNENPTEENLSSFFFDNVDDNAKTVMVSNHDNARGYARNTNFNPHAIALFYDRNDMIVETKDFDLNNDIDASGYVAKNTFTSLYEGYEFNTELNRDYVLFDYNKRLPIKYISYFSEHLDESIMHTLVLIGKDEAREKEIRKIGIFLVNGEIEEDSIPSLTYGVGEGRIMQIHGGERQ